jgi:hypothetical protein
MAFRIIPKSTVQLDLGDGDYLTVKAGLSKGDFRKVLERLPADFNGDTEFNPLQADQFTIGVFDALVVGWSAVDENGEPLAPTVENYVERLDRNSAQAVDNVLFAHFNSLDLTKDERNKSGKTSK